MNNDGVINYNSNPAKITDLKYHIIPGKIEINSKSNLKNIDNNLSKSQNKDNTQSVFNYNENYKDLLETGLHCLYYKKCNFVATKACV